MIDITMAGLSACAGTSRGEAREQAILDAALDLIAEVGYDRMSMDGLAARAHASKATIYRRWPGKAQVVAEAIRRRTCSELVVPPDTGSLRGDLWVALHNKCDALNGEDGPLLIGLLMASRHDDELASLLRTQMTSDKQSFFEELLQRAVARKEVAESTDPGLLYELVPALLVQRMLLGDDQMSENKFLSHVLDDILMPLLVASRPAVATGG